MLAAEGEGFVSEGDGVVSLLFGFYAVHPGGWGIYIWCSHECCASSGEASRRARWFQVQAMAQWHELLHVPAVVVPPLAFANAFSSSSLTAAFCPWSAGGAGAGAA